ncbi:hypothetical protein E2C01_081405 [Portunus trituberculatus]|uniref:Uncharacterized protein n=1 Tax=Portunus trituberculatus TaxID=210409 RepID=A0A5B7IRV3_PORTR|nr:hypothetical protein [Portunus trituberculatus]
MSALTGPLAILTQHNRVELSSSTVPRSFHPPPLIAGIPLDRYGDAWGGLRPCGGRGGMWGVGALIFPRGDSG